mmetsp:Transcript_7298/g.14996  ORF Transcript_7298/g.14996 Transcript_7298/m.14996 type:complete len:207 (-) Transcript_7298:1051-1671(-)
MLTETLQRPATGIGRRRPVRGLDSIRWMGHDRTPPTERPPHEHGPMEVRAGTGNLSAGTSIGIRWARSRGRIRGTPAGNQRPDGGHRHPRHGDATGVVRTYPPAEILPNPRAAALVGTRKTHGDLRGLHGRPRFHREKPVAAGLVGRPGLLAERAARVTHLCGCDGVHRRRHAPTGRGTGLSQGWLWGGDRCPLQGCRRSTGNAIR